MQLQVKSVMMKVTRAIFLEILKSNESLHHGNCGFDDAYSMLI